MAFTGVAAVAPSYVDKQSLPFQEVEIDALSKLAGYRRFDGDFVSFERLVGEVSTGFIHFSGHGVVNQPSSGRPVFAIDLVDQSLDPDTWRAAGRGRAWQGQSLLFLQCLRHGQVADARRLRPGLGPAVLAGGASGFIGGMWPLTDRAAADSRAISTAATAPDSRMDRFTLPTSFKVCASASMKPATRPTLPTRSTAIANLEVVAQ